MLVLDHIDVDGGGNPRVEVDDHVPVTVELAHRDRAHTVYWRAKPSPRTLLDVGVSSETDRLRSVTLTAIEATSVVVVNHELWGVEAEATEGVPCFDLSRWETTEEFTGRFVDEDVDVRLVVADGRCSLEFGPTAVPDSFARVGNVQCAFDADRSLVRIDVQSLDHEQVDTLQGLLG